MGCRGLLQLNPTHDTVPVTLGLVGDGVGVVSYVDGLGTVVDTDSDGVLALTEVVCHIVLVCCYQTVAHSYLLAVDKQRSLDMGTLQIEVV